MLDLLIKLFGKAYVNKIIGTGTNVSKPIKLDKNNNVTRVGGVKYTIKVLKMDSKY